MQLMIYFNHNKSIKEHISKTLLSSRVGSLSNEIASREVVADEALK